MTTKNSSLVFLQAQADQIASTLKRAERGEPIDTRFAARIAEARTRGVFKVGIVMDDKVIKIEMAWSKIAETEEVALAAYIVGLMREARVQ